MLVIPGKRCYTCEGPTRRELLRAGSIALFGLNLADVLALQKNASAATKFDGARGFASANSVIMIFLQGGPSHIDIWDPKPDAPANIRGDFKGIPTKIKGTHIGEHMPMMANALDKATLIRSMSYTPNGLFNHTAAIYQMLTGYPPDRVSPSGQLEPPNPADFPTAGSHVSKIRPPKEAVLPFVELPRPLQESGVIGKGGAAGFLGKAYDPYRLYQDPAKPIKTEDLALRKEVPPERLQERFDLLKGINGSMPDLEKALKSYAIDEYYGKAFDLVLSGKARDAFDLTKETGQGARALRADHVRAGLLLSRRLIEAGTRFVQMNWPAVANGNPEVDSWDTHAANFAPLKNLHCPKLDRGLSALLEDMDAARHAEGHAGGGDRRVRAFAAHRREHFGQLQCARRAGPLALLLQRRGGGVRHRARRAVRRIGPDGVVAQGQAGASQRSAGHGVLRVGHRSRYGGAESLESAARAGEG